MARAADSSVATEKQEADQGRVLRFTVEPRAWPELDRARLGMGFFLVSEAVLFVALVVVYAVVRGQSEDWPRGADYLSIPLGAFHCAVLIASSITMVLAWLELLKHRFQRFRLYLALTVVLGSIYVALKLWEYQVKWQMGWQPSTNLFLGLYYTTTGMHVLHAMSGVGVNAYLLAASSSLWKTRPQRLAHRVEVAGLFWHFVDLAWLLLFPTLYLL